MNNPSPKIKDTKAVREMSSRAAMMPRSAIREIMALAGERPNVIHLELGEPDTSTPGHIVDFAFKAAHSGWTKYSSNAGLASLRELIAQRTSLRLAQRHRRASGRSHDRSNRRTIFCTHVNSRSGRRCARP